MISRIFISLAALLVVSCSQPESSQTTAPQTPQRVVAFAPSLVEFMFEMGLQDRIVGVSAYSDYPAEARTLPVMGHVNEPDYEKMLHAQPHLVLGLGEAVKVGEMAERLGAPFETLRMETLSDITDAPVRIGELLGEPELGTELSNKLKAELDAIRREAARFSEKPRVLAVFGRAEKEVFTTGKGTFVTEMIELAGGISVTAEKEKRWLNLDWEQVLAYQPDVVLVLNSLDGVPEKEVHETKERWQRYTSLPAVRNGRVYVLTGSHLLKSGPRVVQAVRDIADVLHPKQTAE